MSSYSDDEEHDLKTSDDEEEEEEEYQKPALKSLLSSFGTKAKHVIGNNDDEEEEEEDDDEGPRKTTIRKKRTDDDEDYVQEYSENEDLDDSDNDVSDEEVEDEEAELEEGNSDDDDTTENIDEDTDKYTHRFEKETTKDYIMQIHPESIPVSEPEMRSMLNVIRNAEGIIIDDFHKTLPFITKYEKTRIIGQRAAQLNAGAKPYIKLTETKGIIDSSVIAEMEFNAKKIPAIVKRPLPNGAFEYWRLKDLEILY